MEDLSDNEYMLYHGLEIYMEDALLYAGNGDDCLKRMNDYFKLTAEGKHVQGREYAYVAGNNKKHSHLQILDE
jgi:hypothetical protein